MSICPHTPGFNATKFLSKASQGEGPLHKNVHCLADLGGLRDSLASLSLAVASSAAEEEEGARPQSGVHVICRQDDRCDLSALPFEVDQSLPEKSDFDTELYLGRLTTRRLGRCLCLYARTATSTFDLLTMTKVGNLATLLRRSGALPDSQISAPSLPRKNASVDGAVAIADRQTAGRGRGGNVWLSPAGCAMFNVQLVLQAGWLAMQLFFFGQVDKTSLATTAIPIQPEKLTGKSAY